jgi:hypothetical protein
LGVSCNKQGSDVDRWIYNSHRCGAKVSRGGRGRGNGGNKNYKLKGNCNNCGKQGHAEATCWMLPSNASKRPAWFKPREDGTETGATSKETGNKVEYLLMAMELPTDQKFLDNPDVWIGDMGASVHMTPHRSSGMHDVKAAKIVDAIPMANGSSEHATVIGSIVDNKNGMVEETCEQLHRWKESGRGAKIIRVDNAGKKKLLQKRSQSADWRLNVNFEFTARDTPQQNHLAELGFAHLANYGRALMAQVNAPLNI